jgi:hypothetical protein
MMERAGPVLAAAHVIDLATCICACGIVLYNLTYNDHLRVKLQLLSDLYNIEVARIVMQLALQLSIMHA